MRKANRRMKRTGPCMAPMMVMRGIRNDRVETTERAIVLAFELGYADEEHYDHLADMQGLLILAGCTSEARRPAAEYAKTTLGPVLERIKNRYLTKGKFSCEQGELDVLRGFVSMYRDFWMRAPTELFVEAVQELQAHNDRVIERRKAERLPPNAELTGARSASERGTSDVE